MIRRNKISPPQKRSNGEVIAELANFLENSLKMAVEFGNETSLYDLTELHPSFLLIVSPLSERQYQGLVPIFEGTDLDIPFIITTEELPLMTQQFPLELIHIRSDYSLHLGNDMIQSLDITREDVITHLIHDLTSVIIQLRASLCMNHSNSNGIGIELLRRILPICKGFLSLRDFTIPVSWGSLVSELESSYNLKNFTLSEMISALEKDNEAQLSHLFLPLLEILGDLRALLTEEQS